jgi:uncharacterized membrane protein YfcA
VAAYPINTAGPLRRGAGHLLAAVYGGFFGAGLGIITLALLGLCLSDELRRLNALKQAVTFAVNSVASLFLAASGHVHWALIPVMAIPAFPGDKPSWSFPGHLVGA